MTRDTVNVLSIPCTGNTARGLVGNILNVLMMDQVGFSQVHCPCPYSVFTMSWVRKLVFVPSVHRSPHEARLSPTPGSEPPSDHSRKHVQFLSKTKKQNTQTLFCSLVIIVQRRSPRQAAYLIERVDASQGLSMASMSRTPTLMRW